MPENWQEAGFGLYLHWPFCASKCPYCDFNSHVAARVDQGRWAAAFEREIDRAAAETDGRVLSSVFIGGGTPSLMEGATVQRILDRVRRSWPTSNDLEITLEANPGSVEAERFAAYREAGVTRVSLGVQALDDTDLRRLGRLHSVDEALGAMEVAQSVFDRVSFDLIYARQHQGVDAWEAELRRALSLGVSHLSLYQLTIEDGTAFGDRASRGRLPGLPDEDLGADLYELTQSLTAAAGLPAYEVSNHARPGQECRHNLIYWRDGDWVGIGPGAHGRLTLSGRRIATVALRAPGAWLAAAEKGDGVETRETVDADEIVGDRLMMGLRLVEGLPASRIPGLEASRLNNNIRDLVIDGLLESGHGHLRTTPRGRPLLNAVLRRLLG